MDLLDILILHVLNTNENDCDMPFNFGLHPAFNCPSDGGNFEDYYIELERAENSDFNVTHVKDCTRIKLDREELANTIILQDPKSTKATLTNGKHGVTVGFVCIEPWYSHTDFSEVKVPFEQREGTIILKSHDKFHADYTITIF